ncbi:hypothetical protein CWC45_03170 [Neisseria sp. N177_16]|nr:hypothetical protein CWC45_03170 [Neisseria sp. N177_16]
MEKPAALREAIQAALPEFKTDPDRLRIYVDGGEIEPARAPSATKPPTPSTCLPKKSPKTNSPA